MGDDLELTPVQAQACTTADGVEHAKEGVQASVRPSNGDEKTPSPSGRLSLPGPIGRPHPRHDGQRRPRRRHRHRKFAQTWQTASFHFSLSLTFLAIAFVWSITPLSWGYVLWTAFSQLGPASGRPAPPGSARAFTVLHYLTLAYTSLEVLFSIYYRYLAIRAQKLRSSPHHSRKFLRGLILRSLENGLFVEEEAEDEERGQRDEDEKEDGKVSPRTRRLRRLRRSVAGGGGKALKEEEWQERARDEEEAARGSDGELSRSPWKAMRRRAQHPERDGALTPELRTQELPNGSAQEAEDYLSARNLPTLRSDDPPRDAHASSDSPPSPAARALPSLRTSDRFLHPSPSRASLESRGDEGYPPSPSASQSRLSLRTLDSAIAVSPRAHTAPQLPTVFPRANGSSSSSKEGEKHQHHDVPYHPLLRVRLTTTDPRALDFRETFKFWFGNDVEWADLKRQNVAEWFAWALYGSPLEKLEEERKEWDKAGRPPMYLADGTTLDDDSDFEDDDGGDGDGGGATPTASGAAAAATDDDEAKRSAARRLPAVDGDKLGLVHHCLSLVEARSAWRFPSGRNPRVKATRLTLDPVKVSSRPLLLYGVVAALQNGVIRRAGLKGWREEKDGETRYLVHVPEGWEPREDPPESQRPLVFIHGLGMGMAQYATLIHVLSTAPSLRTRPVLVLLQPNISMSFFQSGYLDPLDQKRCTAGLERVMRKYRFDERAGGCTVVSHSNGTIVHAWLVKDCPTLTARNCFVDAVCFQLWEPWVCHNFLVRKPAKPIEFLMRYFVSRELGVALMLSRTFQWTSNLLWPSEIPAVDNPHRAAVFLSEEDSILSAPRMRLYLRRNGFTEVRDPGRVGGREGGGGLKVWRGLKHGEGMCGEGEAFSEVMKWVEWDARDPTAYSSSSGSSGSEGPASSSPRTAGEESS
ncbi:hypothetical protein JCM6882_007198 [Rhodosporidiobolus microsporus]